MKQSLLFTRPGTALPPSAHQQTLMHSTSSSTLHLPVNRRRFLVTSTGLAAVALTGPNLLLRGQDAAGKRLNIAVIGALGKGQSDTRSVDKEHNIVALVDVDRDRLDSAAQAFAKEAQKSGRTAKPPKLYADFRKMLDEMAREIDAVIVSTPDHTHFVAAMWALKHKKHVCVQKPLCNTIWEIRELHKTAKAAGVVTQMGNQGRTSEGHRLAKEWIEQGVIGTLKEVRLWTNRPIWPQGPMNKKLVACPANLNWDLWLTSEADEPYFEFDVPAAASGKPKKAGRRGNSVHPFNWRGWWQFGSGALGDMGCHIMDASFNVLGQRVPEKIEVTSSPVTDLIAPAWSRLVYHFAASGKFPALKVSWNDGVKDGQPNKPERDERLPKEVFDKNSSGMMFIGSEGVLFADTYCFRPEVYPYWSDNF